jgi:RNA polymerase sigma factor (sigma-70 family)
MRMITKNLDNGLLKTETELLDLLNKYAPHIERRISESRFDTFSAHDVRQEIIIAFLIAIKNGDIKSHPVAYLFSIVRNVCLKQKKLYKTQQPLSLDDLEVNACDKVLGQEPSIIEKLEQEDQKNIEQCLSLMLTHLPPLTYQLITKRYLEQKPYDQLAKDYNMTQPAIRKIISRGINTIRNLTGT